MFVVRTGQFWTSFANFPDSSELCVLTDLADFFDSND